MIETEQHYDYKTAARLLGGVSVKTIHRRVADGSRTQGRSGIWPVRVLSRRLILIPASALTRFLERTTPRIRR
jgi:hypothetical protein